MDINGRISIKPAQSTAAPETETDPNDENNDENDDAATAEIILETAEQQQQHQAQAVEGEGVPETASADDGDHNNSHNNNLIVLTKNPSFTSSTATMSTLTRQSDTTATGTEGGSTSAEKRERIIQRRVASIAARTAVRAAGGGGGTTTQHGSASASAAAAAAVDNVPSFLLHNQSILDDATATPNSVFSQQSPGYNDDDDDDVFDGGGSGSGSGTGTGCGSSSTGGNYFASSAIIDNNDNNATTTTRMTPAHAAAMIAASYSDEASSTTITATPSGSSAVGGGFYGHSNATATANASQRRRPRRLPPPNSTVAQHQPQNHPQSNRRMNYDYEEEEQNNKQNLRSSKSKSPSKKKTIWHPLQPDMSSSRARTTNNASATAGGGAGGGGGGLASLQTQAVPAIPDEQDRKRFIGCLAAILSSSYDYDSEYPDGGNGIENTDTGTSNLHGGGGGGGGMTTADGSQARYIDNDFYDEYFHSDDEESDDDYDSSFEEKKRETISKAASTTSDDMSRSSSSVYSRRSDSFESFGADKRKSRNRARSKTRHSTNSTMRRQSSHQAWRKSESATSIGMNSHKSDRAKLSRDRHRSRRYDVMSRLLMSAGEKLLLDKQTSRAFLPMLSPVLVPQLKRRNETQAKRDEFPSRARSAPSSPSQWTNSSQDDSSMATTNNKANASFSVMGGSDYASVLDSSYFSTDRRQSNFGDDKNTLVQPRTENIILPARKPLIDNEGDLRPFLESLSPGSGFRCVSLFLLQHLLTSEVGYDARVRHALKRLSVIVLMHDMENDPIEFDESSVGVTGSNHNKPTDEEMFLRATRKFEALEHNVAKRLLRLTASTRTRKDGDNQQNSNRDLTKNEKSKAAGDGTGLSKEQILRGVKIGGVGIVAGTLFALTGGLAAPGIAAGVAAFAGAAASTAAVSALTSTAVVTTIFGVGGGGLAAYKMQRRTQGLTEFEFQKETSGGGQSNSDENGQTGNAVGGEEAELFSVLCISGWLRDGCDYQRPWGLQPTSPKIDDRQELLERFYSIHSPDHLPKCSKILNNWRGEEYRLWQVLEQKYGCNPDHLFPLSDGRRNEGKLTLEQEEILDKLFVELGYNSVAPNKPVTTEAQPSPLEKMKANWFNRKGRNSNNASNGLPPRYRRYDSTHGPTESLANYPSSNVDSFHHNSSFSVEDSDQTKEEKSQDEPQTAYQPPKHLDTVWDYKTTYGGELYSIKWESELLQRICDCVMDLAFDVVSGATKHILKQTILSTLLSAVMWPSYLLNVANMIDGDWTLAVERADEAGKVLAKTLLFSSAGRRPATLVGYSFGARVIYSCLKELARYQEDWEVYQDLLEEVEGGSCSDEARYNRYHRKLKGAREPASIVEDAVLMGLPNHLSLQSWSACRQVVAGRLVNCYSTKDLILSLMFQAKRFSGGSLNAGVGSILKPVCGTCPVELNGIENVDVSDLILGHQDYCLETGKILERIRFGQPFRSDCNVASESTDGMDIGMNDTAKKLTY